MKDEEYAQHWKEPDEVFEPLSEALYSQFYEIETAAVTSDLDHWRPRLPGGRLLEMGCGNGRLTRRLGRSDREVVGIDLSRPMLLRAQQASRKLPKSLRPTLLQMDMAAPAFAAATFDAILIPWNTLNLLSESDIHRCVTACAELLRNRAILALQLHIPTPEFCAKTSRTFQFQIFPLKQTGDGNGRLIRETLRRFNPESGRIEMEERWRLRPMTTAADNRNWTISLSLCAWTEKQWRQLFTSCDFISREEEWRDDGWFVLLERKQRGGRQQS